MKAYIPTIFQQALQEKVDQVTPIEGLGNVNEVYEVKSTHTSYIIRLNDAAEKRLEYEKEMWCIQKATQLGIPSPKVLRMGSHADYVYMIQEKLPGTNGKFTSPEQQLSIWWQLGSYARLFHQVAQIDIPEIHARAFHRNWQDRLSYNLRELHPEDHLIRTGVITAEVQQHMRTTLRRLEGKTFVTGLVHGDLVPRNVMVDGSDVYLLDWGTAEINIVPHTEIGILLLSEEVSTIAMKHFLLGMGISVEMFEAIKEEVHLLNLLKRLDIYRWAEANAPEVINRYADKVRLAWQTFA